LLPHPKNDDASVDQKMFEADAYILDVIYSFLDDDDFALVNYQSLDRVDPRKYERKSIFAAYAAGSLNRPDLRYIHGLPVDFGMVPKVTLIGMYREDAFDHIVANGIYHPEMARRLMDYDGFREAFPRGVKHYDECTCLLSRKYISMLAHPIRITWLIVDAADNGDISLARWFINKYSTHDVIVSPRKYETYVLFRDHAIIDYRSIDHEDIYKIIPDAGAHVLVDLSKRSDADDLKITWPSHPGILRNAIIHGNIGIVKAVIDRSKSMMTVAYQALAMSTREIAEFVYGYDTPLAGSELCHEYFYERAKRPLSRHDADKAIRTHGMSRGAYGMYVRDGGEIRVKGWD
jgi:hypothetical protein